GRPNDLLDRLAGDEAFAGVDLEAAVDAAKLTGRSAEQVDEFLAEVVEPIRQQYEGRTSKVTQLYV
ncbi:MAG: adenylosuccinate lyase, partial [Pirellulales bacterium]|nr:adenylosuccinate lyase [Pirellulales bacterium]